MNTVPDLVSDTFAGLTAQLAARHDALTVLRAVTDACAPLMSADAAGILVTDPRGGLAVAAALDERARFIELLQAQSEEGPCVDCISGNMVVASADLDREDRWRGFTSAAREAGFRSVYAFPMRLVTSAAGGVNVLYAQPTELSVHARHLGQALADFAVLGLTQERDARRAERLAEQTLTTLNDRVSVSQAVGVLAAELGLSPDDARARLVIHAHTTGRSLRDLARAVTDGSLPPDLVAGA